MGKSQSTQAAGKGGKVSSNPAGTSGVQMRGKQTSQKGKDRPSSYQDGVPVASTDPIPTFKRSSEMPELTGRSTQKTKEVRNPLLNIMAEEAKHNPPSSTGKSNTPPAAVATVASGTGTVASGTTTGTLQKPARKDGTSQTSDIKITDAAQHSTQELNSFEKILAQVTLTWPKFEDLSTLDAGLFSLTMLPILRGVCEELVDEYKLIREYRTQIQNLKDQVEPLQMECASMSNALRERDAEIATMKETIAKLQSSVHDPGYTSGSDELEDKTRSSDPSPTNQPVLSDGSSLDPDDSARFKSRIKEGIYQATPLLLAEGERRSKAVVKRSHSNLKPVTLDQSTTVYERLPPIKDLEPLPLDADLEDKIKYLEDALEKERQENIFLRDRVKSHEGSNNEDSIYAVLPRRTIETKDLVTRYRSLEEHAVGRLYGTVKQNLKDTPDKRRSQFICSVMEVSYTKALSCVLRFNDTVQDLIANPLNALEARSTSSLQQKAPQDRRNNQRPKATSDLPDMLQKQMMTHLQKMADVTDISSLKEMVVEGLRRSYSDCATPALVNQSIFTQFLQDTCRLAWQMAVVNPPLYISTESIRMDDRIHETLMQEKVTNAQVDHYLWPTLFDRKNGHVLYKGRVVIKST